MLSPTIYRNEVIGPHRRREYGCSRSGLSGKLSSKPFSSGLPATAQPFPPRAKNVAAEQLDLPTQVIDDLLVFLGGLIMNLRGLVERGLEVLDMLFEPV